MDTEEIKNLIQELIEKTNIIVKEISITEDLPHNTWFKVELNEPHFYINREGEGLFALNHIVRKVVETKIISSANLKETTSSVLDEKPRIKHNILIDINGFQKKRIDGIRAIAHMMAERARYFKSNIEVDPMSSFERRIVHEFLSNEEDLKTESSGFGRARRVVIKYLGSI